MSSDLPGVGGPTTLLEVISTFVDGERVEPEELKRALELPEGREYLVDLLTIREAIAGPNPFGVVARKPAAIWRVMRGTAAAAVVLLALAGGYFAGHSGSAPARTPQTVPESQILVVTSAPEPPKPTQVIKLEPGVNWSDNSGGK